MAAYLRPTTQADALAALAQGRRTVLAGGTDYYPARVGKPLADDILDISAIAALRGIRDDGDYWRIGATTTWSEFIAGTLAGNLCNASPAADGVPPLLALDARVEVADSAGTSEIALADFILGNRKTLLRPNQLLSAILIPKPAHPARSHFAKLGARKYLVVSIVMVAATLEVDAGRVNAARIAVGAASAVAQRLPLLEAALIGQRCDAGLGEHARPEHLGPLAPIDDVRATREYRLDAGLSLVRRVLSELGTRA